jgi:3-dehydroquinate synthase
MKEIRVRLGARSYSIVVGSGNLRTLASWLRRSGVGGDAVVVTNPLIRRLHGQKLFRALKQGGCSVKVFEVADSERSKSVKVAFSLVEKIARYGADKKVFVVAFGGGVIGDLAGFVASSYKRGVPFVQVPTTLLAQVDSAIGGKVGVDLPSGKNLVGDFYQPKLVLADVKLLSSLSERQVRNGLAEVVKYGVIADTTLFAYIEKNFEKLLKNDPGAMAKVVTRCATIKAAVVSKDERETKGLRTILNFGHTIGHAVEAASNYRIHHGEAVALGMRVACEISRRLKLMSALEAARLETLLTALGFSESITGIAPAKILHAMRFDKKFKGKKNRFVLARSIGKVIVRESVPPSVVEKSIESFLA